MEKNVASFIDISAHRGDSGRYRDNTLLAFSKALETGASSIEFDVHLTADDQVVIYHDFHLKPSNFTNLKRKKLLRELTLDEIQEFQLRKSHPEGDTRLPSLQELLELLQSSSHSQATKVTLHLEIKREKANPELSASPEVMVQVITEVLEKWGFTERVIVRSFDMEVLELLQNRVPQIPVIALFDRRKIPREIDVFLKKLKPFQISPHHRNVTPELIAEWGQRGIGVCPWTVNRKGRMKKLMELGVSGLATDEPALAVEIARELGRCVVPPANFDK